MDSDTDILRYVGGLAAAFVTLSALAVSAAAVAHGSSHPPPPLESSGSVMSVEQTPRAFIFDQAYNTISNDGEILVCLGPNIGDVTNNTCVSKDGKNAWSRMTEISIVGHRPTAYEYRYVGTSRLLFIYFSSVRPSPPVSAASSAFVPTGPVTINADQVIVQRGRNRPGHNR